MTGALQYAEVDAPGADRFAILVGHYARELMQVREIVDSPSGEQLLQRYRAEGWMLSPPSEVLRLQIEGLKCGETFAAQSGEVFEELLERFRLRLSHLGEAVEGREWLRVAVCEDVMYARYPVVALGEDHVTHDVVWTPGVWAFVASGPGVGQTSQESIEGCRCAGEKGDCLVHGKDEYKTG